MAADRIVLRRLIPYTANKSTMDYFQTPPGTPASRPTTLRNAGLSMKKNAPGRYSLKQGHRTTVIRWERHVQTLARFG
jgi:hypothetical protein